APVGPTDGRSERGERHRIEGRGVLVHPRGASRSRTRDCPVPGEVGEAGERDSLAPDGYRGGAGMEVVHRGGVIRRLREELPVGWQVTALGVVATVVAVLAPA